MSRPSLESILDPGETILFRTGVHASVLLVALALVFPPVAYAVQIRSHPGTLWLAVGCTVVSAFISFFTVLDYARTEYVVTTRRILRRGAFGPIVSVPIAPTLEVVRLHGKGRDLFFRGSLQFTLAGQQRLFPAVRDADGLLAAIEQAKKR